MAAAMIERWREKSVKKDESRQGSGEKTALREGRPPGRKVPCTRKIPNFNGCGSGMSRGWLRGLLGRLCGAKRCRHCMSGLGRRMCGNTTSASHRADAGESVAGAFAALKVRRSFRPRGGEAGVYRSSIKKLQRQSDTLAWSIVAIACAPKCADIPRQ